MGRVKNHKKPDRAGSLEKRQAILAALARATGDTPSSVETDDEIKGYYTLTHEQMAALVSGDMDQIESWVSSLDRRHATWLLRWLIKER